MIIIQIAGHLGADPETRFTAGGLKVTTLRVAAKTRKSGKDVTVWWEVTIWGDRFDKMVSYLKKGSAVIAIGEMQEPEMYTDRQGNTRVSLKITADIVKFSPFGKPDRSTEQQGGFEQQTEQGGFGQQAEAVTPAPAAPNFAAATPAPAQDFSAVGASATVQEQISNEDVPF